MYKVTTEETAEFPFPSNYGFEEYSLTCTSFHFKIYLYFFCKNFKKNQQISAIIPRKFYCFK